MSINLDGRNAAADKKRYLATHVAQMSTKPILAVIQACKDGKNEQTEKLVQDCREVGIHTCFLSLDEKVSADAIANFVRSVNRDNISGITVTHPMPASLDERTVMEAIGPDMDVDGLSYANAGKSIIGDEGAMEPPVIPAVLKLLDMYAIPMSVCHILVIARPRDIRAKLLVSKLYGMGCSVAVHDGYCPVDILLKQIVESEVVVSMTGEPGILDGLTESYRTVRDIDFHGKVVIDAGTCVGKDGRIQGDVPEEWYGYDGILIAPPDRVQDIVRSELLHNTVKLQIRKGEQL